MNFIVSGFEIMKNHFSAIWFFDILNIKKADLAVSSSALKLGCIRFWRQTLFHDNTDREGQGPEPDFLGGRTRFFHMQFRPNSCVAYQKPI